MKFYNIPKHNKYYKDQASWDKRLKENKYPKCTKLKDKLFEECPKEVEDIKNPPSACRTCSQYEAPAYVMRDRILKLQEEMENRE